ncbi:DUF5667 domain-containing protein [Cytobacillus praedii]|uniref:DUF5667 domain-containing protein n=1 Tax=Cytobacillus praedii TaxID=1742358 RepID=UPI0007101C3D|nr:DUF5667 domain-containing protein [Cytobacillus praedii]
MKFLSNNELQKLGRTSLALILAGTFTFSTSLASAAENTGETEHYETVELPDNLNVPKESSSVGNEEHTNGDKVKEETPSLLPGSFFYFAKLTMEKIQLALTFNQEKEAKLLAAFAAERLAEAEVLFSEGKEDEALKAIKNSFESLENAESIIGEEKKSDAGPADSAEEKIESEESVEAEPEKDEASEEVIAEEGEVDQLLSQNIIALTAAMEKVKNPKAKAALQKNIEKSYEKLALKIEKMKMKEKHTDEGAEEESSNISEIDENVTEIVDDKVEAATVEKEDEIAPLKQKKQEKAVQNQEKKAAHKELKIQKALIKEETKNAQKSEKQEIKENKEILKAEKKLEKAKTKGNDKYKGGQKRNAQKEHGKNNGNH